MSLILGLLSSYLIGSIPTAFLLGKLTKGIDIRKHGSGNVGATNAFRVLGPYIGITVLVLDSLKGVIPTVIIADSILTQNPSFNSTILRIILGIAAVLGHSWTVFLQFKGGKGMATSLGVLIGLSLKIATLKYILVLEIAIWLVVFLISRIVSLASIVSAILFPAFFILFKQDSALVIMSFLFAALALIRHKPNIYRLLQRKEPRLNFSKRQ